MKIYDSVINYIIPLYSARQEAFLTLFKCVPKKYTVKIRENKEFIHIYVDMNIKIFYNKNYHKNDHNVIIVLIIPGVPLAKHCGKKMECGMETMKALVYDKPGRANGSIRDIPVPACGPGDVRTRVLSCGICKPAERSHDTSGSVLGVYPAVPGHEFAGVVDAVGERVSMFRVGDRVTADNGVPCGLCAFCRAGQPSYCSNFVSKGHNDAGGMAQYVVANESKVFKIPETVSFDAASLSELVGCCLHCVDRANINYGDVVFVFGAGASGSILCQLLLHSNAAKVVVFDKIQEKLNVLSAKGCEAILVSAGEYGRHEKEAMRRYPLGAHKIIDTTGEARLMESGIGLVRPGGTFVGYSFPTTEEKKLPLDIATFIVKELAYIGSTFQSFDFDRVLETLANGIIDASAVITHHFPLERYFEALDLNLTDEQSVKVMIHPNSCDG